MVLLKSCSTSHRKSLGIERLGASLVTLLLIGVLQHPAWGQSASTSNDTAVHPERGGLMLGTSERRTQPSPYTYGAAPFAVDPRLSIFVTDKNTVNQLSFAEVMQQLVDQSGDINLKKEDLFKQWWSTATKKSGTAIPGFVQHCDDESVPDATTFLSTLNKFPYRCPRPEGQEVSNPNAFDPSSDGGYIAIAYSNRFDLADPLGKDCGQYRVVFARNSGASSPIERNLIIFEARVRNPNPPANLPLNPDVGPITDPAVLQNLAGCKPIVDFWASLSDPNMSTKERGVNLKKFYLQGLPGFGPVIHVDNYRGDGQGQIRTNQFIDHGSNDKTDNNFDWTLREFKIARDPAKPSSIMIIPQTVKSNPGTSLFDRNTTDSRASAFYDEVIKQLGPLLGGKGGITNIDTFSYNNPDQFNSFESDEGTHAVFSSSGKLGSAFDQFTAGSGILFSRLSIELSKISPTLTPNQVIARLQTQTCSGCHHFSNKFDPLLGVFPNPANDLGPGLNWTQSLGFTQESERDFEGGPDGNASRFLISDLLKDIFLPERLLVMIKFLAVNKGDVGGGDGCYHCHHHHHHDQ